MKHSHAITAHRSSPTMTSRASAGIADGICPESHSDVRCMLHDISSCPGCTTNPLDHPTDAIHAVRVGPHRRAIVCDMGEARRRALYHPLQELSEGERVVIVGTGETAAIAFEYFRYDTPHEVVAFSAERQFITSDVYCGLPVVPLEELANSYPAEQNRAFVAVSYVQLNRIRRRLYDVVKAAGFACISYVSSHAAVTPDVEIGENTFVQEYVALQHGSRIGDNVYLCSGMCVGYGSVIEADSFSSAHVTIGDFCALGRRSFLGAGSCVTDGHSVAEDCIIGAGAVVLRDTEPRQVYLGNPARPLGRDSYETFGVADP